MKVSTLSYVLIFCACLKIVNSAPAPQTDSHENDDIQIQFVDDWDYRTKIETVPFLSRNNYSQWTYPVYSYARNLEVEGLGNSQQRTNISRSEDLKSKEPNFSVDIIRSTVSCGACKLGVGLLLSEVKIGTSFNEIKEKFVSICTAFKISTLGVCTGLFEVFGPEVLPVLNMTVLGVNEICSVLFGETCEPTEINPAFDWDIELPERVKPEKKNLDLPKTGMPVLKVLQIADTHFDPLYEVGSVANCQEPLCCHIDSSPPEDPKIEVEKAGRWGSYKKCDAPKSLIDNVLRHIALEHTDIDYIIWTGDIPPHDVWLQSKQSNLDIIKETVEELFTMFPNVPIFPAIGNHEGNPAGNFAPPWMKNEKHSISWLYQEMAEHWRRWLPPSAGDTVQHGLFYSVLLRPGFRLISLNTNYCHTLSWWLFINSTDPANELKWLVYELQEAENKGEIVHLIGHIAPGSSDCLKTWSRNFYKIIERYEDTVIAQFYGHSHADEFELFYDTQEYKRPTGIAYLAPSVTTYENHNPAYRIYYIDGEHNNSTWEIIDHETWTTDLQLANQADNEPIWYKLYTAKDAYKMESLRPTEWNKLLEQLIKNEKEFELFYKYYFRDSPTRPVCDLKCRVQILCDLKSGKSQSRLQLCQEIKQVYGVK